MARSERLFDLLHVLRGYRRPVSGRVLADAIGVSLRTLYRDIGSLQALGALIDGEPGVGYVLKPGFLLPPLMFTPEELEALVLGSRWVADRTDTALHHAARSAMARISDVLPPDLRDGLEMSTLLIGPSQKPEVNTIDLALLRKAIRMEYKLVLSYRDAGNAESTRTVWPFAMAFFDTARVLLCWCEIRQDFRHFRTDRIISATRLEQRYSKKRSALLREWRAREGIAAPVP